MVDTNVLDSPATANSTQEAPAKSLRKTAAKKKPTKTKIVAAKKVSKTEAPDRTMSEVPAGERRVALVKALRQFKAVGAAKARPLADLVAKLGYTRFDVYGLIAGTSGKAGSAPRCLIATGHVAVTKSHPGEGMQVYLTRKGQSWTFDEAPLA